MPDRTSLHLDAPARPTPSLIKTKTVYSNQRRLIQPDFMGIDGLALDAPQKMDGLALLDRLDDCTIPLVFFDPQYRTILDKQNYGNEGEKRGKRRAELPQMTDETIAKFIRSIDRVLMPSGHLMLWVDKFILCNGFGNLTAGSRFKTVDLITWNKGRMGMGYRTRRYAEYLLVFQKPPKRAKGVWRIHDIPDVWTEKLDPDGTEHTHRKPIGLQQRLIEAVTNAGDLVVDPAAGGYSVLHAALAAGRHFLGCDLLG